MISTFLHGPLLFSDHLSMLVEEDNLSNVAKPPRLQAALEVLLVEALSRQITERQSFLPG
jgi:hypothetical protein